MKKNIALFAFSYLVLAAGSSKAADGAGWADPGVALKIYYAGSDKAAFSGSALNAISALPATQEFKRQISEKLAAAPQQWFQAYLDKKNQAERFRPLAEDLFTRESIFEYRPGAAGEASGWALGVRLNTARAQLWSTNLWQFFVDVKGMKPAAATHGWEAALTGAKQAFRFSASGEWCYIAMGGDSASSSRFAEAISRRKAAPLENGAWMSFHAAFAGLKISRFPGLLSLTPLPGDAVVEGSLTWKNGAIRTTGSVDFSRDVNWELEPWRTPVELIRDPLVSFTAIQGLRPWIAGQGWIQQTGLNPAPNQCFVWAQSEVPFLTFGAAPIKGAASVFDRISPRVASDVWDHVLGFKVGEIAMQTNKTVLGWTGLPLLTPFLQPQTTPSGEYLFAGLFRVVESTNAAPAELFSQLAGKTNLLAYEWELSQERLGQIHILTQIKDLATPAAMSTSFESDRTNGCAQTWIAAAAPHLGNSITAIAVQSARKLTVTRQSNVGLDSLEILELLKWLDHSRYPLFGKALAPAK